MGHGVNTGSDSTGKGSGWLFDDLFPAMRRYWFIVAFAAGVGVAAGVGFVLKTTIYYASSTIAITRVNQSSLEALNARFGGNFGGGVRFGREDPIVEKLIGLLTSRLFFEEVARALGEKAEFATVGRSLRLMVSPRLQQLLESLGVLTPSDSSSQLSITDLTDALTSVISIGRDAAGNLSVGATVRDKQLAVSLANVAGEAAVEFLIKKELAEFDQARIYIATRIETASLEVERLNEELQRLREPDNFAGMPKVASQLLALQQEHDAARLKREQNSLVLDELRRELERLRRTLPLKPYPGYQGAQRDVIRLGAQFDALTFRRDNLLAQGHTEDTPEAKALEVEIRRAADRLRAAQKALSEAEKDDEPPTEAVENQIRRLVQQNLELEAQVRVTKRALDQQRNAESALPNNQQKITEITRKINVQYDLITELYRSNLQFDFQRISAQNKLRLTSKAHLGSASRRPRWETTIGFMSVAGLVFGSFCALMLDRRRPTINSRFDLSQFGIPVIGSIPVIRDRMLRLRKRFRSRSKTSVLGESFFASNVVAFKFLRTRMMGAAQAVQACHVITVQSASPAEGKTFLACNLAAAFAAVNKRVLLLDSDILGSRIAQKMELRQTTGLTDVLAGRVPLEEALLRSIRPNLDLLLAGPRATESTEMLASAAFRELLEKLRTMYDFIVIDTAPILLLPDALLLADLADSVLISVRRRKTRFAAIAEAINSLATHRTDGTYFILNFSEPIRLEGAYRYAVEPSRAPTRPNTGGQRSGSAG